MNRGLSERAQCCQSSERWQSNGEAQLGSNKNPLTREAVVEAAINCIERFGVAKTSVIDVARALGVTRQTVHRLFETRASLLEAVAEVRIEIAAETLQRIFTKFDDLETALVEGSLVSLAVGRSDAVLEEIRQQADHSVDQFMFRGSPKVQALMLGIWSPILDRARSEGRLRDNLDNEQAVEWIRNVHAMINIRVDYSDARKEQLLRDFLVPSLVKG